jgi:hypothetical protein
MRLPAHIAASPPQTPGTSSFSTFQGPNPQATTSSSVYSTPSITPVEAMFPSTLRRRQSHIPSSLILEPPSPTTTGQDLENQTPIPTPTRSYFRRSAASSAKGGSSPPRNGKYSPKQVGSSGWVTGAVDKFAVSFVRYTRDEGSEEGLLLPLS